MKVKMLAETSILIVDECTAEDKELVDSLPKEKFLDVVKEAIEDALSTTKNRTEVVVHDLELTYEEEGEE